MKTFGLVLAMVVLLSVGCLANTAVIDLYATKNLVTIPQVPINPDPSSVFSNETWDSGIEPIGNIQRWFTATNRYNVFDPDNGLYGNMLLGDGFWCSGSAGQQIKYDAVPDGVPDSQGAMTDMWISLPGRGLGNGGKHLVGTPFAHDVITDKSAGWGDNIFFTDGQRMLTWGEAVDEQWVDANMQYWNGSRYMTLSVDSGASMKAGRAYWIATSVDNLAMIVPAN